MNLSNTVLPIPAGIEHDASNEEKESSGRYTCLTSPDDRGPLSPYDDNEVVWSNKSRDLYFLKKTKYIHGN